MTQVRRKPAEAIWIVPALFVLLALGLAGSGYRYFLSEAGLIRQRAAENLEAVARMKVEQIVGWRTERLNDAEAIRQNPWAIRGLSEAIRKSPTAAVEKQVTTWLEAIRVQYDLGSAAIFNAEGKALYRVGVGDRQANPTVSAAHAEAIRTGNIILSDLHRREGTAAIHLSLLVPIIPPEGGGVIGILSLRIDPGRYLFPLVQTWPSASPTAETLIVRREGESVLYLNDLRHLQPGAALTLSVPTGNTRVPAVQAVLGRQGIFEGLDYRGVAVLSVLRHVPDSSWYVVAKIDDAEVSAPVRERARAVALEFGALLVIAGFVAVWGHRRQQEAFARRSRREAIERQALVVHFDYLTRHANDIILLCDAQGSLVEVNERAVESYGYNRDELIGLNVRDLHRPEAAGEAGRLLDASRTSEGVRFETEHRRKDGTTFPVEISTRLIRVDGEPYSQSIIRDVTERKLAEAQIARMNRLYAVLSECNQAIVRSSDKDLLLRQLCRIAVDIGAFRVAWIGLVDKESGRLVSAAFDSALRTGSDAARSSDVEEFASQLLPEAAVRERRVVTCADSEADPVASSCRRLARRFGFRAGISVPLFVEENPIGALALYAADSGALEAPEVKLVVELGSDIGFALQVFERDSRRRASELALRDSEERHRLIFEANPFPMYVVALESSAIIAVNDAALRQYGYSREEFLAMTLEDIRVPAEVGAAPGQFEAPGSDPGVTLELVRHRRKDGSIMDVEVAAHSITFGGQPAKLVAANDVTARRQLEAQFRQSQKMEAVGRLAGGIAHDFNNLLTVIDGFTEMTLIDLPAASPHRPNLEQVRDAAALAGALTRQLLAFSRKQILQPAILDLNQVVADVQKMLKRVIGEDVELELKLDPRGGSVRADRNQLEQVLLNLSVNARDAMPRGGRLIIGTSRVEINAQSSSAGTLIRPGSYMRLTVGDSGIGMSAEALAHLFEPFFTTKEHGKGTGLGLSTVHGIVTQNEGYIAVESRHGEGTTFSIDFPRIADSGQPLRLSDAEGGLSRGSETILIVEDNLPLRNLSARMLGGLGYRVLAAASGSEAIAAAESHVGTIHLLLTDVVMPGMRGDELARWMRANRPGAKVLFMSGYADDLASRDGAPEAGVSLIQKPFSADALSQKVREVLDSRH